MKTVKILIFTTGEISRMFYYKRLLYGEENYDKIKTFNSTILNIKTNIGKIHFDFIHFSNKIQPDTNEMFKLKNWLKNFDFRTHGFIHMYDDSDPKYIENFNNLGKIIKEIAGEKIEKSISIMLDKTKDINHLKSYDSGNDGISLDFHNQSIEQFLNLVRLMKNDPNIQLSLMKENSTKENSTKEDSTKEESLKEESPEEESPKESKYIKIIISGSNSFFNDMLVDLAIRFRDHNFITEMNDSDIKNITILFQNHEKLIPEIYRRNEIINGREMVFKAKLKPEAVTARRLLRKYNPNFEYKNDILSLIEVKPPLYNALKSLKKIGFEGGIEDLVRIEDIPSWAISSEKKDESIIIKYINSQKFFKYVFNTIEEAKELLWYFYFNF